MKEKDTKIERQVEGWGRGAGEGCASLAAGGGREGGGGTLSEGETEH